MNPTASKRATAATASVAPPVTIDAPLASEAQMDPSHRHMMIAEAAFFIAQARGFTPGEELEDWLAAEREIDQRLSNPET